MSSVHDATSLIADRRRRARRRRLVVLGAGLGAAVVVGVLVWLVGFSSVFALRTVAVTGTSALSAEEVQRAAAAPVGTPLVRVAERPVAERVAALPRVKSVTVRRHWPTTLDVVVTERTPAYALERGGRWLLVDADGVAFAEGADRPEGLVAVYAPGDDRDLLRSLARVTAALPPEITRELEKVEARSGDAIVLRLKGRQVALGSAADIELKMKVALALLAGTRAAWIDVSAPAHPATR